MNAILDRLELPLRPGMTLSQVSAELGVLLRVCSHEGGEESYEFAVGSLDRYLISCTIDKDRGLVHLVIGTRSNYDAD